MVLESIFKSKVHIMGFCAFIMVSFITSSKIEKENLIINNIENQTFRDTNSSISYVINLNEDEFPSFNATNHFYFLVFYASWCSHCKKLKPVYEKAAKRAFESGSPIKYVAIEATENQKLSDQFRVRGYPTMWFINNKKISKQEYLGQKTEDAFNYFAENQIKEFIINKVDLPTGDLTIFDDFVLNLSTPKYLIRK